MSDALKVFWAIEKREEAQLEQLCKELKQQNNNILLYASKTMWWDVFTAEEAKTIQVVFSGCLDFSPLQHTVELDWLQGFQCLLKHQIGCQMQGSGLPLVPQDLIREATKRLNNESV
jgi:hypothetical protein